MDRTENKRESRNRSYSGMIFFYTVSTGILLRINILPSLMKYHAKYFFLFEIQSSVPRMTTQLSRVVSHFCEHPYLKIFYFFLEFFPVART